MMFQFHYRVHKGDNGGRWEIKERISKIRTYSSAMIAIVGRAFVFRDVSKNEGRRLSWMFNLAVHGILRLRFCWLSH
jgi:hypothetical protein